MGNIFNYSFLVSLVVIASVSAAPPHQTPFRSNNEEQNRWMQQQNSPHNESPYHVPSLFSLQHLRGIMDFARRPAPGQVRPAPGQVPVVIPTPSPNSGFDHGQFPPFGA